jgi:hypothetical protein
MQFLLIVYFGLTAALCIYSLALHTECYLLYYIAVKVAKQFHWKLHIPL